MAPGSLLWYPIPTYFGFLLDRIEVFLEYVEVEGFQFRIQHETVVPDTDEPQRDEGLQLVVQVIKLSGFVIDAPSKIA